MNLPKALFLLTCLIFVLSFSSCSRQPYARVTVEFGAPNDPNAENTIRALLPKNDSSVVLRPQRNTSLYEIGVYDPDPKSAAVRANQLATTISNTLLQTTGKGLKIWERAEPPISR